jgi:hypothetical protein
MRAVARLGGADCSLYERNAHEASRIDSFLDASVVFARDAQHYLLGLLTKSVSVETHARVRDAFQVYTTGIDRALSPDPPVIVGETLSLQISASCQTFVYSREG